MTQSYVYHSTIHSLQIILTTLLNSGPWEGRTNETKRKLSKIFYSKQAAELWFRKYDQCKCNMIIGNHQKCFLKLRFYSCCYIGRATCQSLSLSSSLCVCVVDVSRGILSMSRKISFMLQYILHKSEDLINSRAHLSF